MHKYLAGQKRTKLRNAILAGGCFLVSFKRALGVSKKMHCILTRARGRAGGGRGASTRVRAFYLLLLTNVNGSAHRKNLDLALSFVEKPDSHMLT
jgi:hypothetical protein